MIKLRWHRGKPSLTRMFVMDGFFVEREQERLEIGV